ncbi:metallopeptidase family protein [Candidatus Kaiserbacteria bacterium]|nr:metallopeptidase family protein [Candidatus Kaiserbacteria bacterium]
MVQIHLGAPIKMERVEFAKLVREGCERLPAAVREKIRNVAILIEDEPSEEVREREGLRTDETLLGYYHGVPLTGRDYANGPVFPDVITLFQRPIENAAREDGADVRDVIADTIWHEFAHHFGMDEDAVRARERKRK